MQTTRELILAALNNRHFKNQKVLADFLEVSDAFISEILGGKKIGARSFLDFKNKLDPILYKNVISEDEIDSPQMHQDLDIIISSGNFGVIRAIKHNLGEFAMSVRKDGRISTLEEEVRELKERQAQIEKLLGKRNDKEVISSGE